MSNTPFLKKTANFVYDKFSKNVGSFLLVSGIVGWMLSCVNQTVAILINDKIPTKQKKFMIPQEIADGIINTLLFAAFTRSFTKVGERLVQSGRLATKDLRNIYKTKMHNGKSLESLIKNEMEHPTKGKNAFNLSELPVFNDKTVAGFKKEDNNKYFNFATGVSFVFSTVGSIISCDFVTPFVRNKIASHRQKQYILAQEKLDKQQKDKQAATELVAINTPVLPSHNKPDNDNKIVAKPASITVTPRITSGGGMKV